MKPKYSLIKNFFYAIDGLKILSKEPAFKIEITFFIVFGIALLFLSYPLWAKIVMFATLFIPLIAEAFNTAVEKTVDLIQDDYHILAKQAKDIAAFGVFLAILLTVFLWLGFIIYFY